MSEEECDPGKNSRKQKIRWLWRKKNKVEECLEMRMNESDGKRAKIIAIDERKNFIISHWIEIEG